MIKVKKKPEPKKIPPNPVKLLEPDDQCRIVGDHPRAGEEGAYRHLARHTSRGIPQHVIRLDDSEAIRWCFVPTHQLQVLDNETGLWRTPRG